MSRITSERFVDVDGGAAEYRHGYPVPVLDCPIHPEEAEEHGCIETVICVTLWPEPICGCGIFVLTWHRYEPVYIDVPVHPNCRCVIDVPKEQKEQI